MADLLDGDFVFHRGMKSDSDPGTLPLGYYWSGINVLNIGGVVSCRPGHRCIIKFPAGKLQGSALFRPKTGFEQILVCIDGVIYVAPFPFTSFRILPNVLMSPFAKQIFWQMTTQSARRVNTDFSSPTELIDPREVMFIQDGGFTAPAWFDGSNSGHIRGNQFETPAGGSIVWVGDRLWVATRNRVVASDVGNPFSFREQTYLGSNDAFYFDSEVTAMAKTPSLEFPQLVVFTENNTSIIQANIRERAKWPITDGMQTEVFQIGCVSQRSITLHHGQLTWFAPSGIVFFNAAKVANISSHIPIRDNEMLVSKSQLSPNLSLVASAVFGNYVLMSVPATDVFNKHTWVLNGAAMTSFADESGESWASYWLGTRPVEWIYGTIAGRERIYHISADEDGENRLWESFTDERLDNGCPITWAMETRGHFGQTSHAEKNPGGPCRYGYSDVALCGVEEELDIAVYYAGGTRGAYKNILAKRITVERGSIRYDQEITATTSIFAFKPQSRGIRTQDANQQSVEIDTGSCPPESEHTENLDDSFQLLIVGHGPAGIRWIRSFAKPEAEDPHGESTACENEAPHNAVRFDGAGVHSEDLSTLGEQLDARPLNYFTSVKAATVEQDGVSATGIGVAESIISQNAADRVAEQVAIRAAENDVEKALPPVLSVSANFQSSDPTK